MNTEHYVHWFRHSSPYINAHRGKTFVLMIPGEALSDSRLPTLIHDIALLNSLGIRLVLIHGARPQIATALSAAGLNTEFVGQTRVTDQESLEKITAVNGNIRFQLEALLSMGLANSPMHGADIQVTSGNFITAQPMGVVNGIDFQHTGEIRKVNAEAVKKQLDNNAIALISPIGFSTTGELFNLHTHSLAAEVACALKADKLILLGNAEGVYHAGNDKKLIRDLTPQQVKEKLGTTLPEETTQLLNIAKSACHLVKRTHLISYKKDGALLEELFTRDGCGTLVTQEQYEQLRPATIDDVGGILELIEPLEEQGVLVKRSRELLESEINRFTIIELDGTIVACAAVYPYSDESNNKLAELACVAVNPEYRDNQRGQKLLQQVEKQIKQQGINALFVLTTQTAHWFQEQGFEAAKLDDLPKNKQSLYNLQRNSKVFIKQLYS